MNKIKLKITVVNGDCAFDTFDSKQYLLVFSNYPYYSHQPYNRFRKFDERMKARYE